MALLNPLLAREHYLTNEQIARLNDRIEELVEILGPRDQNDILDLTPFQKHAVDDLWAWIDDNLGAEDED